MTRILHHLRQAYREWRMGRAALTLIRLADAGRPHDVLMVKAVYWWMNASAKAIRLQRVKFKWPEGFPQTERK